MKFTRNHLQKKFNNFIKIYKDRPIKNNRSGMKIEHCFALYSILKKIKPKYVIESGVWKGQTTWLIKSALKNSKIFSIDIDLSQRELIYKDVKYLDNDITKYDWSKLDKEQTLIIFDDHVCFSKRLRFIKKNKFKHIIFDDNLPNNHIGYYTPRMMNTNQYLIKKEFIKYTNVFRLIKFMIRLLKKNFSIKTKIIFYYNYIKIIYPIKNKRKIKKEFLSFKKNLQIYYEFPPLVKFDYKKRFKKILNNFEEDIDKDYYVKKPIFKNTKNIFSKELENEFNLQYSNLCYMKFK